MEGEKSCQIWHTDNIILASAHVLRKTRELTTHIYWPLKSMIGLTSALQSYFKVLYWLHVYSRYCYDMLLSDSSLSIISGLLTGFRNQSSPFNVVIGIYICCLSFSLPLILHPYFLSQSPPISFSIGFSSDFQLRIMDLINNFHYPRNRVLWTADMNTSFLSFCLSITAKKKKKTYQGITRAQ